METEFSPNLDILPAAQRQLWSELRDTPEHFTLYGGTALALHLGHRKSVDFDFFGTKSFDPDRLLREVSYLAKAEVIQKSPNTLTVIVERIQPVQVSFFGVPDLGQIEPAAIAGGAGVRVASLLDLAGTKAAVVQKRAEAKDYIDVDALIRLSSVSLAQALAAAKYIYGERFVPELTLKALCYFGDGNLATIPDEVRYRLVKYVGEVDLGKLPEVSSHRHGKSSH